jgi:hypothetical protein
MRMKDERVPKKAMKWIHKRGKTSWKAQRRMLKCRNWRRSTEDKDSWRRRIGETKAQVGRPLEEEELTAILPKLS